MLSFIRFLAISAVCFFAIGLHQGWFSLSRSETEPNSGKMNVNLSVDKVKMKSDLKKAEERVEKRIGQYENKKKDEKKQQTTAPTRRMDF
jgi:hypothetical protein